jgi:hypothetical protein
MSIAARLIVWLAICVLLAFVFAIVWVVVMTLSLPPTDKAYGQMPFADPLIFPIMSMFALGAAILVYPFTCYALLNRRPAPAALILAAIVLAEIIIVTPLSAGLGFLLSFIAYGIGLPVAHRVVQPRLSRHPDTTPNA